ncbi:hypothetical protein JL720_9933 [Aureococcus anophagefferens]|nr:hypothetical protein JL720_9933 [Aureococcus anophagefferens]
MTLGNERDNLNVIGSRRASWRVISSIEQKSDSEKTALITNYKRKIETELENICGDILQIIGDVLIPNSVGDEGKVFYYKMKGDYHRYLAEFQAPDRRKTSSSEARVVPERVADRAGQG